jgi:DNA-binding transcriptional ArsR family regulator
VSGDADIAAAARLLAQPARAALVLALMEDGALPASELARRAGVSASTASSHLATLVSGGFLVDERAGRHRYFRLADPAVAQAVEALAVVAPRRQVRSLREATAAELIRDARTCYDHLAGRLGVAVACSLERDRVVLRENGSYALGLDAERWLAAFGIELSLLARRRRPLIRGCLDWSERELHVAGSVGAALTARMFELGWLARRPRNRSVEVTVEGRRGLVERFGLADADLGGELSGDRVVGAAHADGHRAFERR